MKNKHYLILEKKEHDLYCANYTDKDLAEEKLIFFLARGSDEAKIIIEEYFNMPIEEAQKKYNLSCVRIIDRWFFFAFQLEKEYPVIFSFPKEK